jgi:hypothetical protein
MFIKLCDKLQFLEPQAESEKIDSGRVPLSLLGLLVLGIHMTSLGSHSELGDVKLALASKFLIPILAELITFCG